MNLFSFFKARAFFFVRGFFFVGCRVKGSQF